MYPVLSKVGKSNNMFVIYKDNSRSQVLSTNKKWITNNASTRMSSVLVFKSMADAMSALKKITEKTVKAKS